MTTRNKIMDDLSQLMTNAMGVAQGAKDEANNALKSMMDRWLADRDLVTREEFGAVGLRRKCDPDGADRGARRQRQESQVLNCTSVGETAPKRVPTIG